MENDSQNYFVDIEIFDLGRTYPFPLLSQMRDGVREWNDKNYNNRIYTVSNVALDELKKYYPSFKYKILRGVYFEKKNGQNNCSSKNIIYDTIFCSSSCMVCKI